MRLPDFSEVLAVGTAGLLVSVRSITRKSRGEVFMYDGARVSRERVVRCFWRI